MRHASRTTIAPVAVVELRKMVDTRSGRWLLVVLVAASVGVVATDVTDGAVHLGGLLSAATAPLLLLCPLVAVLSGTHEWQGQTFARTFTLVPDRRAVVVGKLVASTALVGGLLAVSLVSSAVVVLAVHGSWGLGQVSVVGIVLAALAYVVQGLAFGLVTRNALLAMAAFLLGPIVASTVVRAAGADALVPYLNLRTAMQPVVDGGPFGVAVLLPLAVALLVWVAAPAAIGMARTLRADLD